MIFKFGFILFFACLSVSAADGFLTYDKVEHVVAQDGARFSKLFSEGKKRVVRLALFGDSQETAPGGGGRAYLPRLNFELSKHYGNSPETLIEPVSSLRYSWLQRSGNGAGKVHDFGDWSLPDVRIVQLPKQGYTWLVALQHDGTGLLPEIVTKEELTAAPFFRTDGVVKAEVFALTQQGAGTMRFEAKPSEENAVNFYKPITNTGLLDLKLNEGAENRVVSAMTPALDFGGKKYMQLQIRCEEAGKMVAAVGMRFRNETHAYGMVVNDFSHGGYRLGNLLKSHAKAGDMYRAFGFDAAILHLGANDAGSVSAVDFKKHTEQVIAQIRGWVKDPHYKIILMGDPDLKTHAAHSPRRAEFDQFPGAQAEIAKADVNVMVLNSRRIAEELAGWKLGNPKLDAYLADQVHYTVEGGRVLATAEMEVLLEKIAK